jgi:polysaccharide biosynthesis/export protein
LLPEQKPAGCGLEYFGRRFTDAFSRCFVLDLLFEIRRLRRPKRALIYVPPCAALALAGCGLPSSGPSSAAFAKAAEANAIQLVDATAADAAASRQTASAGFPVEWTQIAPPSFDRIGPADVLRVVILENDGLGLFAGGQTGGTRLEAVPVDSTGAIDLPYIGRVQVAGLSLHGAGDLLLKRLGGLVSSADVQVSFAERHSNLVSVEGDVAKPGPVALTPETSRLTSLLGVAAPSPANIEHATVTVRRGTQSAGVPLSEAFDRPSNDITLQAGDVVVVRKVVQSVNVLGSAGVQGRVPLTKRNYTVMDAVAESKGLSSDAANPAAVYLMTLSDSSQLNGAGPKVYHFDFRNPAQLAVASAFVVHDGDVIYISGASFAQTRNVLSALSGVLNSARSASVIAP